MRARVLEDPKAQRLVERAVQYLHDVNGGIVLVGCSYGRHRSVAIADEISRRMRLVNDEPWETN
jgi:RNase adaptor protein for sRNA GlmZ degradation